MITLAIILLLTIFSEAQNIISLTQGVALTGNVPLDRWDYYSFNVPANQGWVLKVSHGKTHDVDLYVRKGDALPNRSTGGYDYKDSISSPDIKITGPSATRSTNFTAGVFGFKGSYTPYSILLELTNGCPMNCSGNGVCSRGVCVCNAGFTGVGCETAAKSITQDVSYDVTMKEDEWVFYSFSVFSANNIFLDVNQKSGDVDAYMRFGAVPGFSTYDYVDFTRTSAASHFNISIAEPHFGTWYIGFFAWENTVFSFKVTEKRECPMQCSKHGRCVGSRCVCETEYIGLSCEERREALAVNISVTGYVDENYWNWYRFQSNSFYPFIVRVTHQQNANCDIYILDGEKPTTTNFLYKNDSTDANTAVTVYYPYWFNWNIGVYGATACEYSLTVIEEVPTPYCPCLHGNCTDDGRCVCNPGYSGAFCDTRTMTLTSGVVTDSKTIQNDQWFYYQFDVTNTTQMAIVLTETNSKGMVWVYVATERYPTLYDYDESDSSSKSGRHQIIKQFNTALTRTFYVGVYRAPYWSEQVISYKLQAWQLPF